MIAINSCVSSSSKFSKWGQNLYEAVYMNFECNLKAKVSEDILKWQSHSLSLSAELVVLVLLYVLIRRCAKNIIFYSFFKFVTLKRNLSNCVLYVKSQ